MNQVEAGYSCAATAAAMSTPDYQLLRLLGEGQMGVVWLAQRVDTGALVAIKFLRSAQLQPERQQWFLREIETMRTLVHPYFPKLYDTGTLPDGTPWFAMEFIEGERLVDYCLGKKLSTEERLDLFREVCEAVRYSHGKGIIHRDVQSANIVVDRSGRPYLLDFGVARKMQDAEDPGFYADIYSLAVVLYEMMHGEPRGAA